MIGMLQYMLRLSRRDFGNIENPGLEQYNKNENP